MEVLSPHCPFCGAKLPDDEGHARLVVVRCTSCKKLIDVPDRTRALEARQAYAAPAHFEVHDHQHEGLEVSWSWYHGDNNGLHRGGALMFGVMTFVFPLVAVFGLGSSLGDLLPLCVFPLPLALWHLACLVNRTRIEVTRHGLKIRHGPFPFGAKVDLRREELDKLCVTSPPNDFFNRTRGCSLTAIDPRGVMRELLTVNRGGLATDAELLWLEQELKRHLGLED